MRVELKGNAHVIDICLTRYSHLLDMLCTRIRSVGLVIRIRKRNYINA